MEHSRIFFAGFPAHLVELSGIDHSISPQSRISAIKSGSGDGSVTLFPVLVSPPLVFSSGNGSRSIVIDEGDINIQNGAFALS